jgi:hypothetical protein
MKSIYDIDPSALGRLNGEEAVRVFRDLLWSQARKRGVPTSKVHITTTAVTTADGGIDAAIDSGVLSQADDLLLEGGTGYQIKAGKSAKPWQDSWLKEELFGGSKAEIKVENLGEDVLRRLKAGGRYVLVCFGCSPTPQQTALAREKVESYFARCGFPDAPVEIWGQDTLLGLISAFPSLGLEISGRSELKFQSHVSWAVDSEMGLAWQGGASRDALVEEIRDCLQGNEIRHVRLIGEPGIGKTRLILEATAAEELAPLVVYVPHAEDFQKSRLFNELLRPDNDFFIVLVIDECPPKERASIWTALKGRSERCRLVTIDHGPEDASDELMQVIHCPGLEEEQIANIIAEYIPAKSEAKRWAEICGGSPRVAHAIGQNLKRNPDDILKPPATVPIWDRFIEGYDDPNSSDVLQRKIVLRCIALFAKFGFEQPVDEEAQFVVSLAKEIDSSITWPRFREIVQQLKQRRILQGKTTLFVVPKALHIHLWVQFWERYGGSLPLGELLQRMPEDLRNWLTQMLPYAHASEAALKQMRLLLGQGGPFSDEKFVESEAGGKLLNALAEAVPEDTLRCIEDTLGRRATERLRTFEDGRHYVVSALGKIAVWPELFVRASGMLLKLGEAENSTYSNNASGTFAELFSLIPGLAATTATSTVRLEALLSALTSLSPDQRRLGLRACAAALSTYGGHRFVGPEYQGLRPEIQFWRPKTYGELFDAYRAVWNMVLEVSEKWERDERTRANGVLIQAATGLVQIENLAAMVFDTLDKIAEDEATDIRELVKFITHNFRFHEDRLKPDAIARIEKLERKLEGTSFESRLRRAVLFSDWGEERLGDDEGSGALQQKVVALAEESVKNPAMLVSLLPELVRERGLKLYDFGYALARQDKEKVFLDRILDAQKEAGRSGTSQFLGSLVICADRKSL